MTKLFGKGTGFFIHELPTEPIKYTTAVLTFGNIINPDSWEILEVPLSHIKRIATSPDELHKLEVEWIDGEEYAIDYFNTISFK